MSVFWIITAAVSHVPEAFYKRVRTLEGVLGYSPLYGARGWRSPVAETGLKAFQRAKTSQDKQLNTFSCIFLKYNIKYCKDCLKRPLKKDQKLFFKSNYHLMSVINL